MIPPASSKATTKFTTGNRCSMSSLRESPPSSCQLLVRFENTTHVVSVPTETDTQTMMMMMMDTTQPLSRIDRQQQEQQRELWLLEYFSKTKITNWNIKRLFVRSWCYPFVEIAVKSQILGGKGGFGTLLKGQSRQAGAKLTTDFGACRDLQGRRLRHVNDEIKLRKWREMERAKASGEKVDDDVLWKTPSGIYNWHLMTPTWADISKKATYRIKRQFQAMDKAQIKKQKLREEKEQAYQNSMKHYLEQATEASSNITENFKDALKQGLEMSKSSKKRKKREFAEEKNVIANNNIESYQPNSLCTLSGDIVVKNNNNSSSIANNNKSNTDFAASVEIQSKSDFATAVLVLDRYPSTAETVEVVSSSSDTNKEQGDQRQTIIYYEVSLETGGMAQIGWACLVGGNDDDNSAAAEVVEFQPNNELGDGVGDDNASYGVDGTRKLKFHSGQEEVWDGEWKQGDRLGCIWNTGTGSLSFQINGKDCFSGTAKNETTTKENTTKEESESAAGAAFSTNLQKLVPAFSCNQNEILGLHIHPKECKYLPKVVDGGGVGRVVTVGELIISSNNNSNEEGEEKKKDDNDKNSDDKNQQQQQNSKMDNNTKKESKTAAAATINDESSSKKADDEATKTNLAVAKTKMTPSSSSSFDSNNIKPLDLSNYESSQELESLGMDRLKGALMAIKVKCGGTLAERAARLFSLKGLQRKDYPKKVRAKGFIEY